MSDNKVFDISSKFFSERTEELIVYVVSKSFTVYNGVEFFKYYTGKPNYIKNEIEANNFLTKIYKWILKNVQKNPELIGEIFSSVENNNISQIITPLIKLFSASQHQAVGPDILDPIIIVEDEINKKQIIEIVSLHEKKFLNPTIIISMKDDNFTRIKELLSKCPNGTTLKLIENSGKSEITKVINTGAENVQDFIDSYARQCFNACSYTPRDVLFNNEEWAKDSVIRKWSPGIMKIRSNLLYDKKDESIQDVKYILNTIGSERKLLKRNEQSVSSSLECMVRLFGTYCNDTGGDNYNTAYKISKELDNEILSAHVLRFSHFLPNTSKQQQKEALDKAQTIFSKNRMEDYGVYCNNNSLVSDFYNEKVYVNNFEELRDRALHNVPGLVGMSTILNNVGVAYLYNGRYEEAIEWLNKGTFYDKDRNTQQIGLKTNILIAKSMLGNKVNEIEIKNLIIENIGWFGEKGAFLGASYILNLLLIANKIKGLTEELFFSFPAINKFLSIALSPQYLGSGSLAYQLSILSKRNKEFEFNIKLPANIKKPNGKRGSNIELTGFNPAIYNAWL